MQFGVRYLLKCNTYRIFLARGGKYAIPILFWSRRGPNMWQVWWLRSVPSTSHRTMLGSFDHSLSNIRCRTFIVTLALAPSLSSTGGVVASSSGRNLASDIVGPRPDTDITMEQVCEASASAMGAERPESRESKLGRSRFRFRHETRGMLAVVSAKRVPILVSYEGMIVECSWLGG